VLENELGISPQDRALLIREVNVVFHSAASIKFTEPIKFALQMNTFGTRKVIQLCRDLQNLEVRHIILIAELIKCRLNDNYIKLNIDYRCIIEKM